MSTSGNVCSFKNCKNNNKNCKDAIPPIQFFRFPVSDKNRCLEWIHKSGRDDLMHLEDNKLRNRRVCSSHFLPNFISSSKKLFGNAIPEFYEVLEEIEVLESFPNLEDASIDVDESVQSTAMPDIDDVPSCSDSSETELDTDKEVEVGIESDVSEYRYSLDMSSETELITPRKLKIPGKRINKVLSSLCDKKNHGIKRLKDRASPRMNTAEATAVFSECAESEAAKVFLGMQTRPRKCSAIWAKEERNLALSFYYRSPSLYMFMQSQIKFKLPPYTSLIRWINTIKLKPGFCNDLLEQLGIKIGSMNATERECVLFFDEMPIKKCLKYDSRIDLVDEFEDLVPLGPHPHVATQAMVFMVRGLKHSWKQHFAYFLSFNGVTFSKLSVLIKSVIEKLFEIGLRVRVAVCDQGSPNREAFQLLGVSIDAPYFFYNDHKVIALFDVPHLLKSVRNNLINHDFLIDKQRVSWKDIAQLYNIDVENGTTGSRVCPRLTAKHVYPGSFAKMSVKLASQVFSHSVKAGMATAHLTGQLHSSTVLDTIDFVSRMNDLFDCLNSRYPYDSTPHRRPISNESNNVPSQCLLVSQSWLKTWRLADKVTSPPCFAGLQMAVNAVMLLWQDLAEEGTAYLLTSRLNQDPLENSFAILRNKSGCNNNPSASQFRRHLQQNTLMNLLDPPNSSNCETDNDVWLRTIDTEEPTHHHQPLQHRFN